MHTRAWASERECTSASVQVLSWFLEYERETELQVVRIKNGFAVENEEPG